MSAPERGEDILKSWQLGFLLLPALHLAFCFFVAYAHFEGSWGWFLVFVVDLPCSILWLGSEQMLGSPLMTFGTFGTLWWLALSLFFIWSVRRKSTTDTRAN